MTSDIFETFRLKVSQKLKTAITSRDKQTVYALRAALHAVDNASAVSPVGPFVPIHTRTGITGEVVGQTIDREAIERILLSEAQARKRASDDYEKLGRAVEAQQIATEAEIIRLCLTDLDKADQKAAS